MQVGHVGVKVCLPLGIYDERHQYDHHQNVDKAADIRRVASFGQQEPFELFSQYVTSRIIKGAGIKPGWGFLPASNVWRRPHTGYGVFRLRMNFHDTHSNIWDLSCKLQSCASLRKFCANVVPYMKIDNSWKDMYLCCFH